MEPKGKWTSLQMHLCFRVSTGQFWHGASLLLEPGWSGAGSRFRKRGHYVSDEIRGKMGSEREYG